jgi:HD superfamily phosphohydrolase YqeK
VKKNPDLEYLRESVVICALFHDLCKTNFYEKGKKWTKDDAGKWKEYDSWLINDKLPLGHGEKSLYIVSKYLELTNAEAMAIRWHMGHTEISIHIPNSPQSYAFNQAVDNPLVYIIHCADMLATTMEEKKDLKNS